MALLAMLEPARHMAKMDTGNTKELRVSLVGSYEIDPQNPDTVDVKVKFQIHT